MRHFHWLLAAAFVATVTAACEDNPVLGPAEGSGPGQLFAELTLSSDHIHTLSELTFTVTVRDGNGDPYTDLERVAVERRQVVEEGEAHALAPADEEPWRATELELQGTSWVGTYTFMTSGEYEVRVVGQMHGEAEASVLYEMPEHAHVVRPHVVVGDFRVEFESFPGHLHAGNEAEVRFWILAVDRNEEEIRPPIAGLEAEIHCAEEAGFTEEHHAHEIEPGVYSATHEFQDAGDFHAEIHFIGADGQPASAEFVTHVVAPH